MLAGELALQGVEVAIVERRRSQELDGSRARGLHSRSIEVLDQRGIAGRFLARGQVMPIAGFAYIPLDIRDFPTRHHGLALMQQPIEEELARWVAELGVETYRGREVIGFTQDEVGVDVALSDGSAVRAQYLVGCDGGRSAVRKLAGIEFKGWEASISYLIAECTLADEPPWGIRHDDRGVHAIGKAGEGRRAGVVSVERQVEHGDHPTVEDLRAALIAVYGSDFGVHDVSWISRFSDLTLQAVSYRDRRVLIAGDAAHVHSPVSGQGLNLGLQDAVNLGWKLAQVVHGTSPEALLDTYTAERHPVAARVCELTMAQTALGRGDDRTRALHRQMAALLKLDEARKHYAGMITGLDIHYDLGDGHPLLGRRMPDLDLVTADGPRRVFELLHAAQHVLIDFGSGVASQRVRTLRATTTSAWELPVIGAVPAPSAVLIRPDGHVAWVGDGSDRGLREAIATWTGGA